MAIITKYVKGRPYLYRVKSYRDRHRKPRQKVLEYLGLDPDWHRSKPVLPKNAPTAVVLFSGGGGVEVGMVEAGIRPVVAIEFDPSKPELSAALADAHQLTIGDLTEGERADIWLADGTIKQLTIECVKRLCSFPCWYHLPDKVSVAGSILGYSVPPKLMQKLLSNKQ